MKRQPLGALRWPWRVVTVTPAHRPRLIALNRYPGQIIGFAIRLPDEETLGGQIRHKQLSILWGRAS